MEEEDYFRGCYTNVCMNYYDETIIKIRSLIDTSQFDEAERLIRNELDLPYVPKDFEIELNDLLMKIRKTKQPSSLSDEQIEQYLYMDDQHQIVAVDDLNRKNLRDYYELCNDYLQKGTFSNAKVLLIDSLIRQEINKEFSYIKDGKMIVFNPSKILPPEESPGYKSCINLLNETFMKEPSKLLLAKQLLYKEAIMMLPDSLNEDDGIYLSEKISDYINNAFNR